MATPIPKNRASFELESLASLGHLVGPLVSFVGVTSDSRAVGKGELFVALRGENFDGHRYVASALAKGAAAVLVSDPASVPDGASALVVDDTLVALGELARLHRRRWGRNVVGITGSAGKTTTKELVRAALAGTGLSVHATLGNLNNRIGVPMTLLALEPSHDIAVVEMGTSEVGEIAILAAIAEPDLALITSIGLSHAAGIGTVEDVAIEKGALFDVLGPDGIAIVNLDDARVRERPLHVRKYGFGIDAAADIRLVDPQILEGGSSASLVIDNKRYALRLTIPSVVALVDAAGAIGVVHALGRSIESALEALAIGATIEGRMHPVKTASGILVVDDTYNANPRSMLAALESTSALARSRAGALVAVLGDMRELGEHANEAHHQVGLEVAELGVSRFVAVGVDMRVAAEAARARGVETFSVDDAEGAAALVGALEKNDVVVVKGSRSMRMERVVEALVAAEADS